MMTMLVCIIYSDWRFRRIPNWVTAPGAVIGFLSLSRAGWGMLAEGILSVALITIPLLWGFERGWLAGGDVKLVCAVGLLSDPDAVVPLFAAGSIAAGLYCLYCLLRVHKRGRRPGETIWVPYGAVYATGVLVVKLIHVGLKTGCSG